MSEQNLEVVRAIYRALAASESTADLIDADAVYVNPRYAIEPGIRPWAVAIERLLEIYPEFLLEPVEYLPVGDDQVMVIANARARGVSGAGASARLGHLWTIRDGRAIRFEWFKDPVEAYKAVRPGPARPQAGSSSP